MGKKGSMPNYETVDDYIANQSIEAQKLLHELREIIKRAVPDVIEVLNYKVPSFILVDTGNKDHQIMMAGYSKFVSFYPFPSTLEKFADRLKSYKQGKGSVQFPFDKPLPEELIMEMVRYRRDEILSNN